ncbi:MAG: diguanylate cyclase [Ilumatobacter sp.]
MSADPTPAPSAPDLELDDARFEHELRQERFRLLYRQRVTAPLGVFAAAVAFAGLSNEHLSPAMRATWLAVMVAMTLLLIGAFVGPTTRVVARDGLPVTAHVGHVGTGLGWGATLWLDIDEIRDGPLVWIALTIVIAVLAGATAGIPGSNVLGRNLVVATSLVACPALVVSGRLGIAAAFALFAAILLTEVAHSRVVWEEFVRVRLLLQIDADAQRVAATHDTLTKALNRSGVHEHYDALEPSVARTTLFVDLNHFKDVNDRFGHRAGDLVLITVARRLEEVIGLDGVVGRFGGDEFVVVVATTDDVYLATLVRSIENSISDPIDLAAGRRITVTASVGKASADDGSTDFEDLLDRADQAQYREKRNGPSRRRRQRDSRQAPDHHDPPIGRATWRGVQELT